MEASSQPDIWAEQARQLINIERPTQALPILTKALAQDPDNAYFLRLLARIYYGLKDIPKAMETIQKSIARDPLEGEAHRLHCWIQLSGGTLEQAAQAADEALRLEPESPASLSCLFEVQIARDQNDEARLTAQRLLEKDPESPVPYRCLGYMAFAKHQFEEAERLYTNALNKEPNHSRSLYMRGRCFVGLGRTTEAIQAFDSALHLNPIHREYQTAFQNAVAKAAREWKPFSEAASYNTLYPLMLHRQDFSLSFADFRFTFVKLQRIDIGRDRYTYFYFKVNGATEEKIESVLLPAHEADIAYPFECEGKTFQFIIRYRDYAGRIPCEMFLIEYPASAHEAIAPLSTGFSWTPPQPLPAAAGEWTLHLASAIPMEAWCRAMREMGSFIENEQTGRAHFVMAGHEVHVERASRAEPADTETIASCWFNSLAMAVAVTERIGQQYKGFVLDQRGPKRQLPLDAVPITTFEKKQRRVPGGEISLYEERNSTGELLATWNDDGTRL